MKKICIFSIAVFVIIGPFNYTRAGDQYETMSSELLSACRDENGAGYMKGFCDGYYQGTLDLFRSLRDTDTSVRYFNICLPGEISNQELATLSGKYYKKISNINDKKHNALMDLPAAFISIEALGKIFPCSG